MKNYYSALAAFLPCLVLAADNPSLVFPEQKIGLPSLSLAAITPLQPQGFHPEENLALTFVDKRPIAATGDKFVYRPREDADYKLLVKAPDASIDFKLIVAAPRITSAK